MAKGAGKEDEVSQLMVEIRGIQARYGQIKAERQTIRDKFDTPGVITTGKDLGQSAELTAKLKALKQLEEQKLIEKYKKFTSCGSHWL